MRNLRLKAPSSLLADYYRLFVNRLANTLQSNRPHPERGRHYYYCPKDEKTGQMFSLAFETIRPHLKGELTIDLYAINPATQCAKWVAIDGDYKDSLADFVKLSFHLRQDGVKSALENSHPGGHLWIFLAELGFELRFCCVPAEESHAAVKVIERSFGRHHLLP